MRRRRASDSATPRLAGRCRTRPVHTQIFFSLYFTMTGLHALHMIIGIGLMLVITWMAWKGEFDAMLHAGGDERPLLALRRHRLDLSVPAALSHRSVLSCHVGHVPPVKSLLVGIFLTLMVLTAVTVAVAYVNLGRSTRSWRSGSPASRPRWSCSTSCTWVNPPAILR